MNSNSSTAFPPADTIGREVLSSVSPDVPFLSVQEGYGRVSDFVLEAECVTIGRDPDCTLVLQDRHVSGHHAQIVREKDSFILKDLSSGSGGTFVNGQPVSNQSLKHMDTIQVGSVMIVFNDLSSFRDGTRWGSFSRKGLKTENLRQVIRHLESNIAAVFKGNPDVVRNLIVCLLADGHLLLKDAPGVGKSLLAQTLAKSVQAVYRRIQFTPDMLPSDITGANVYDERSGAFTFLPGPIFGNVILADEINRTTPRTQSSLLECMSESSVTIDGRAYMLPKPFFVIATQNPEDYQGTYPLPEPQLDRFLMCLQIGYPPPREEIEILDTQIASHPLNNISYVIQSSDVVYCQALVRKVHVSTAIKDYIVRIANETRAHPALVNGMSPRASLALMRAGQSLAVYNGRDYVTPKDIREMLSMVIAHRLRLRLRYRAEFKDVEQVLTEILGSIKLKHEDKV